MSGCTLIHGAKFDSVELVDFWISVEYPLLIFYNHCDKIYCVKSNAEQNGCDQFETDLRWAANNISMSNVKWVAGHWGIKGNKKSGPQLMRVILAI